MSTDRLEPLSVRPLRAERWPKMKQARHDRELTQQRLAELAGVSIATVRDLENNERTGRVNVRRTTWARLTRALGVEGFSDLRRIENR